MKFVHFYQQKCTWLSTIFWGQEKVISLKMACQQPDKSFHQSALLPGKLKRIIDSNAFIWKTLFQCSNTKHYRVSNRQIAKYLDNIPYSDHLCFVSREPINFFDSWLVLPVVVNSIPLFAFVLASTLHKP